MNKIYYGKIGGGKTYLAMFQEIIPALRSGRKVVTNIDGVDVNALRNYVGRDIEIRIIKSHEWYKRNLWVKHEDDDSEDGRYILSPMMTENTLYVIDEVHDIWNSRKFKDSQEGFLTLLSYNRHFGIDLVFITQNVGLCEVNITRTANESYQVKNLGFLSRWTMKKYVVNRRQTPKDKEVVSQYTGTYDKSIFSLYRSGTNAQAGNRSKAYLSNIKVGGFVVMILVSILVLVSIGNPITAVTGKKKAVKDVNSIGDIHYNSPVAGGVASSQVVSGGTSKETKSSPEPVSSYRGYIKDGDNCWIISDSGAYQSVAIGSCDELKATVTSVPFNQVSASSMPATGPSGPKPGAVPGDLGI